MAETAHRGERRKMPSSIGRALILSTVSALAVAGAVAMVPSADAAAGTLGAAAAAGSTVGCGKTPTLTSGTRSIQSGGQTRSYILSIPASYDSTRAYRLIFGLHWLNGTANDVATGGADGSAWAFYGQKRLSNDGTIFVAPQGINNGWGNTNGRDVTLVDDLIKVVENDLCVDTSQVFSMGWSYGGAMSYALACARPNVFRAVVAYSAGNLSGCSGGTQPVAYFGIHGTHDSVVGISSGRSLRDTFVRNNGCVTQNPREPSLGSLTHITTAYAGCRAGYPVQWAAFDGDHIPSPVDGSTSASGTRTWTSAEVNSFLAQFQSTPPTTPPTTTPPNTTPPATTPPVTTPPVTTPPATTLPPQGACSATYRTVNFWPGGFQGEVTVTAGNSAISGWTVRWTLGNGQTITQVWSGTLSVTGQAAAVSNVVYNGSLPVAASTTFGFLSAGTPSTPALSCTSP